MRNVFILFAALIFTSLFGNCLACYPETDECRFAKKFGLESNTAKSIKIQENLSDRIAELQTEIERIADKNTPHIDKIQSNGYVSHAINEYFESKESTVQLKSLGSRETLERSIYAYLRLLADYSEYRPNEEIQIAFYKDMNQVLGVAQLADNSFLVKVDTWALFTKKNADGIVRYEDVTNKVFYAVVTLETNGMPTIKIGRVTVIDTYSVAEFKKRLVNISSN